MKRIFILIIYISLFVLLAACTNEEGLDLGPKKEVSSYSSKVYKIEKNSTLKVDCDFGNIYVYCWDSDEIKFDVKRKIRGIGDKAKLEKKLSHFKINSDSSSNIISFSSKYEGKDKDAVDNSIDANIYVPRTMGDIYLKLDTGVIKINDNIKCNLKTEVNMANVEVAGLEGNIQALAQMGNIRLNSGNILKESNIKLGQGHINIKADFSDAGFGQMETSLGNIELQVERNSLVEFETVGDVEINEFKDAEAEDSTSKIKLSTSMGKISIRKY
ncbi:MAG TPA: hypothetical protein VIO64_18485 [Pseudobacteroides sp.]|uniref:hypothetical protein n=1 Tax=Pseudobacteroides sp. TaxID=1968840 RepID=UPI002F91D5F3